MISVIKSALLLPAHGHAPYQIGASLLTNLVDDICIPDYSGYAKGYGEKQRNILRDKFPDDPGRIFLSAALGERLQPFLLFSKESPNFDRYASNVRDQAAKLGMELANRLREGIEAVALDGTRKTFTRFDFAVNTGLPVYSPVKPVYYAFVSRMSAIYRLSSSSIPGVPMLARAWEQIEQTFDHMFIPRVNSLYKKENFASPRISFTPPFAQPVPVNQDDSIPQGAILVVVSGTGKGLEKLIHLIQASPDRHWVTLPESAEVLKEYGVRKVSARAWGNPSVTAVIARSGLGSIWDALLNQKPIGVVPPEVEDDPEVYHNAEMVANAKFGMILDRSVEPLMDALAECLSAIQNELELEHKKFHTTNGIEYTSQALKQLLPAVAAK